MNGATNNVPSFPGRWRLRSEPHAQLRNNNPVRNRPSRELQPHPFRTERVETSPVGAEGDMGTAADNLFLVPGNQRSSSSSFYLLPPLARPPRPLDISAREPDTWRLFEDRVRTGPYGLNRFPSQPYSPMRVITPNDAMGRGVSPMLRQFIEQSPPWIRNQWQMRPAPQEDESRMTREEQEKALKKLKKQIYFPKTKSRRWSVYYRDNVSGKEENETDEDGKRCAVCLEDFFAREEVLVTPCNHMFHEDCIVPWVKDNGQCPVCRFALGEHRRGSRSNINANLVADDLAAADLLSLVRAMEEAFEWLNVPH